MNWETIPKHEDDLFAEAFRAADELYNVRDTFFPRNPLEKTAKIRELSSAALLLLDSIPSEKRRSPIERATFEYLRGKIIDAVPEYKKEAEEHLAKAVKLNPSLGDAWLSLANCIWKKGELMAAKNCLTLALRKGPHKKILCQLSMLERKMAQDSKSKEALVEASIKHAKEAVSLDVKDGYSWYILGNAFLTSFFMIGSIGLDVLHQAVKAYQNAERDDRMESNPDLSHNSAYVHKYLENYERALSGFEATALKDPGLGGSVEVYMLVRFLDEVASLLKEHAKAKPKRFALMIASLKTVKVNPPYKNTTVDTLHEGENRAVAVVGKVLECIRHELATPKYYILCDSSQTCCVLSVYGVALDFIKQADQVTLLDPCYRDFDFSWQGKHYQFKSIRVDHSRQILVNQKDILPECTVQPSLHAVHQP